MSRGGWPSSRARRLLAVSVLAAAPLLLSGLGPAQAQPHTAPQEAGPQKAGPKASTADTPRAAYGAGALSVQIDTMSPAIPGPKSTLTLRGTVTNTSDSPVGEVSMRLRASPTPLYSRGEITEVLAGAGQRTGEPVAGSQEKVAGTLAPGQTASFAISGTIASLALPRAGAYMVGAEALGNSGAGLMRQDMDRTFLPWWPKDTEYERLRVTTIWPLVGAPEQDTAGALPSEAAAEELTRNGRLGALLSAAAEEPGVVSLVIDPQVALAAQDLADGYFVGSGEALVQGAHADEVADWLGDLRSALTEPAADASLGLYGLPDVVAARRGGLLTGLLAQRPMVEPAAADVLGHSLSGPLALPPGRAIDQRTLTALADDDVRAVLLADTTVPLAEATYFTPSGSAALATEHGDIRAMLADSGLTSTLAMPMDDAAHLTAARQRLLAETLTTITELPESARMLVAAPEPAWPASADSASMVVQALATAPWIIPTTLTQALDREPSTLTRQGPLYPTSARDQEIPAERVAQVSEQIRDMHSYAGLVADPASFPLVARTAPARGLSGWFRGDPEAGQRLVDRVSAQVATAQASVRVVSSGTITVSGETGTIPITIENQGGLAVRVGLELTSDPPQLFQADPIDLMDIPPHKRTSIEVVARVAAAGKVPVTVQLTTAEGEPFGEPGELIVQTSAYASAARILVRVALVGLIASLVVHAVRRARRMRQAAARREGQAQSAGAEQSKAEHG